MGKKELLFGKNIEQLTKDVDILKVSFQNLRTAYTNLESKSNCYEMRINTLEVKSESDDQKIQLLSSELEKAKNNKKSKKKLIKTESDEKRNEAHKQNDETGQLEHVRKSKSFVCYFCGKALFTTNGLHRHVQDVHKPAGPSESVAAKFFQ